MGIPDYDELMLPFLRVLEDGAEHPLDEVRQQVAQFIGLAPNDLAERLPSGTQTVFHNRMGWAKTDLEKARLISTVRRAVYMITARGSELLRAAPRKIDATLLRQFPEYQEFRPPSGGAAKIDRDDPEVARAIFETVCSGEPARSFCLRWIADAIGYVNERAPASWGVTLQRRSVRLNVGRMLSFDLPQGGVRIGLAVEALDPVTREMLNQQGQWSEEAFSVAPECRHCILSPALLAEKEQAIKPAWLQFLRVAIRTGRQTPFARSHSPGFLAYLGQTLGIALPPPRYRFSDEDGGDDGEGDASGMPLAAVRADDGGPLFKETSPSLAGLLHEIESGDLGLPDIQRPFVWSNSKVRDLIDSMYRGFPVGYLLFWETPPNEKVSKTIGTNAKDHEPKRLIIDGQQRLTALYAVLHGKKVRDDQFRERLLEVSFRPRDSHFEVANAATRNNAEYIANISDVWRSGSFAFISAFLKELAKKRSITPEEEATIAHNIGKLALLERYSFAALEILSRVSEEAVADIFVRINSQGKPLNQADFILTLLSVHWDQGRRDLEAFSKACTVPPVPGQPSPYNHFIDVSPDQLLRVAIAIGYHRGKLRSAYQVLRGKDPETGRFSAEVREAQFARLKDAQAKVLDLLNWHGFLDSLIATGFRSDALISSESAVIFAYAFYLIGKTQCGVDERTLKRLIGRWFFATALTGRYSSSTESLVESDLARFKDISAPGPFIAGIEELIASMLPDAYWETTLLDRLETSSAKSPAMFAFLAAQNRLGAPVLFSDNKISELFDPLVAGKRKKVELHHLFPKNWLQRQGIITNRETNQAANFTLVEWLDNSDMSDSAPAEYLPPLRARFSAAAWERMTSLHALPEGWEAMPYEEFLVERRIRISKIIRSGFTSLSAPGDGSVSLTEGTPEEQAVWSMVPKVERRLRDVVGAAWTMKFGDGAEVRMRGVLGEKAWELVERNRQREAKRSAPAPSALEYLYLRQLVDLLIANEVWDQFKPAFKEKARPIALIDSIAAVRNDLAHFRTVAPLELDRCRIACVDMLNFLQVTN